MSHLLYLSNRSQNSLAHFPQKLVQLGMPLRRSSHFESRNTLRHHESILNSKLLNSNPVGVQYPQTYNLQMHHKLSSLQNQNSLLQKNKIMQLRQHNHYIQGLELCNLQKQKQLEHTRLTLHSFKSLDKLKESQMSYVCESLKRQIDRKNSEILQIQVLGNCDKHQVSHILINKDKAICQLNAQVKQYKNKIIKMQEQLGRLHVSQYQQQLQQNNCSQTKPKLKKNSASLKTQPKSNSILDKKMQITKNYNSKSSGKLENRNQNKGFTRSANKQERVSSIKKSIFNRLSTGGSENKFDFYWNLDENIQKKTKIKDELKNTNIKPEKPIVNQLIIENSMAEKETVAQPSYSQPILLQQISLLRSQLKSLKHKTKAQQHQLRQKDDKIYKLQQQLKKRDRQIQDISRNRSDMEILLKKELIYVRGKILKKQPIVIDDDIVQNKQPENSMVLSSPKINRNKSQFLYQLAKGQGLISSIITLRNGINRQVFSLFVSCRRQANTTEGHLQNFLNKWRTIQLCNLKPYVQSYIQTIETLQRYYSQQKEDLNMLQQYFKNKKNRKQVTKSEELLKRKEQQLIVEKIQQVVPTQILDISKMAQKWLMKSVKVFQSYYKLQKKHKIELTGRSKINIWTIQTLQFAINQYSLKQSRKPQQQSEERSLSPRITLLFRLLTIQYKIEFPPRGHEKDFKLDNDVRHCLLHYIVVAVNEIIKFLPI